MNTSNLKKYGPEARRDFIKAVRDRAAYYGLTADEVLPMKVDGEAAIIGDNHFPASIAGKRKKLEERIKAEDFDHVIEAIAYTWFNRLVAIRYMELRDYLDHGYRVLSHPEGDTNPEILAHAEQLDLPGLANDTVVDLKLAGDKDAELYRLLLIAQCNALSKAMPFLFERIDDESELLLPENLLKSDSLIRRLVSEIPEEEWQDIEVIGWLYQFYISEKKDEVIGKTVKSEDIPAATQLFTPNWIVKYMVQNSLGAQWLATYPESKLRDQMEFYIEPAEQTDAVKARLKTITPDAINPEELTLIDPACGSGHILVEAYDLFKTIYLERGYRQRDLPKLILEKNLFGLDIDVRAAQLSGFALMMKGRADDRTLLERGANLNIVALQDCAGFDVEGLARVCRLSDYGIEVRDLDELKALFESATTFGSLIQVPEALAGRLSGLRGVSQHTTARGATDDWILRELLDQLSSLVQQAELLAVRYDVVVANPPYMGGKSMNAPLKKFAKDHFPSSKSDLFAVSAERFLMLAKPTGFVGLMTPFTWMFLKSYESLRALLIDSKTFQSLVQPEYHAFFDSAYVPVCTFVLRNCHTADYDASFINLSDFYGLELQSEKTLEAIENPDCGWLFHAKPDDFKKIPGSPAAYWVSSRLRDVFERGTPLGASSKIVVGLQTGENDQFMRYWYEPSLDRIGFGTLDRDAARDSRRRWFPYNKGGEFRRWYGNQSFVVNWEDDGREIREFGTENGGRARSRAQNTNFYFRPSLSWSKITSGGFALRRFPPGFVFDVAGCSIFSDDSDVVLGCLNSVIMSQAINGLSPTLNFEVGQVQEFPILQVDEHRDKIVDHVNALVAGARSDWDCFETSWGFESLRVLPIDTEPPLTLESCYSESKVKNCAAIAKMKLLEEENNRLFIEVYGLKDELSPEVPLKQITLSVNPAYRYGGKLTEEEQWTRFRQDTMQEIVSYAIGCMMGRYSLDEKGLMYANSGSEGFDAGRYTSFPADDDGIIPLTDAEWFDDDATHRLEEFISVAWGKEHLDENLNFLANNLSPKKGASSRDTIRRYMSQNFFKDHLKTYKKRPIYWLFSSGKNKALECLVYLHRYNEGTLSRMRTEYVIPLQGKVASRISQLSDDIGAATSTSHRKQLQQRHDVLVKHREELRVFDEKLRHYADQRIHLDLDDGVKVNYGKFGDLLANVKDITGKKPVAV